MTEKQIQSHLFIWKRSAGFSIPNILYYKWESDFLFITHAQFVHEFEIKITKNDFKKDFQKTDKHDILAAQSYGRYPNRFWYICPEGLIQKNEVPNYAGLIYCRPKRFYPWIIKKAPRLHKNLMEDYENYKEKFFDAMYHRYWNKHLDLYSKWRNQYDT